MVREHIDRYGNPHYEGKNQDYRTVESRNSCAWCDADMPFYALVHHKDCNRNNNELLNLLNLCGSCHKKYHQYFPNWRYLHDYEIEEIISAGIKVLGHIPKSITDLVNEKYDELQRRVAHIDWVNELGNTAKDKRSVGIE